jgi:hypothetical protein
MGHSIDELVNIVYGYYPRGLLSNDPGYKEADVYCRLVAARRQAGADNERWRAMLKRVVDHFPESRVENRSIHLPTGSWDACYSARISLPTAPGEYYHDVGFLVSFLVPYYVVYSLRCVDDVEEIERRKVLNATPPKYVGVGVNGDTMFILPAGMVKSEFIDPPLPLEAQRKDIRFDLSPDEHPYAEWITRDIEATWGYERMPPEVGKAIVPDVSTNSQALGEATLYDCLFSDDW